MSFRDRSNVIELSKRLSAGYKVLGKEYGILWLFPLVLSNSYVSIWRTKGPACTENQEDVAFENLLNFIVMKENGQKDNRSLQIILSSMLNSEQVVSSVNWEASFHTRVNGLRARCRLQAWSRQAFVVCSTAPCLCHVVGGHTLSLLGTDSQTWQVTIREPHSLNSFLWNDIKAYSRA